MKLAVTGHRANKIDWSTEGTFERIVSGMIILFAERGVKYVYEGQADGADLMAAYAAFKMGIPFEAVVPYAGHKDMMPSDFWKNVWQNALGAADNVEILSDSTNYPGPWCMHNRNHYMVDHADEVMAFWNGEKSGGTWATIKYAHSKGKKIHVWDMQGQFTYYYAD